MSFNLPILFSFLWSLVITADPGILRVGNGIEPQDLDPHRVTGAPEGAIIRSLFEGLVVWDQKAERSLPGVASSWKASLDGLTWTFEIRSDAKWSNGDRVTAQDFVYSWRRLLDPATAAPLASLALVIKNAGAFQKGELKDPAQLGVKAPTPDRFIVHLNRPAPYFIKLINHVAFFPVPQKTVEKFQSAWTRPQNMVSNGAFKLIEWTTNKVIRVAKQKEYWDAAKVKLSEVQFFPADEDTAEALFQTGKLDISDFPMTKVAKWRKDKSGALQSHRANVVSFYRFNVTKPPFNDARVRKALSLAVDRKRLVEKVIRGGQTPLRSFVPEQLGGDYSPIPKVPVDLSRLAEAKRLLIAAGFNQDRKLQLEITINRSELHQQIAEAIQYMWKKNLGVESKINVLEWKVYLDAIQTRTYQIARTNWLLDYEDPEAYLESWVSDNSGNETGYNNPAFDRLFREAIYETKTKQRLKKFQEAEALLMDDMPLIPLYVSELFYLKRPEVDGYLPNSQSAHSLKFVSKR